MLNLDTTALLVIDIQGKLAQLMHEKDRLFENCQKLIKGARTLTLPILWTEQIPDKLGPTVPEIASLLSGLDRISKVSFSCWGEKNFVEALKSVNRKQILLAGIECHICVYQTAIDLLNEGYEVQVVSDAVSSRFAENRRIGLERIKEAGARLTTTEMALFELLKVAEGDRFREIIKIVK